MRHGPPVIEAEGPGLGVLGVTEITGRGASSPCLYSAIFHLNKADGQLMSALGSARGMFYGAIIISSRR